MPHPPSYPPKTPPPPKRPVEAPRPQPVEPPKPPPEQVHSYGPPGARTAVATRGRMVVTMANRRGANWTLDTRWAAASAPTKAQRLVGDQLKGWGYRPDTDQVDGLLDLLVTEAIGDGGNRISVHLADQEQRALILVMSHQDRQAPESDDFLTRVAALGVASCGVDTDPEEGGRRRWALIELRPAAPLDVAG
ncbi:hypothetical protein [Streptomyces sp. NPDC059278]|uniref:hypothetical protein n=1 Tax=Streptomyces sp. NPDC059278 TaxID=3346801 RepID=UPI0036B88BBA